MLHYGDLKSRCTVLTIDFQNDYCHPAGALGVRGSDVSGCRTAVENTNSVLSVARKFEIPCIHVKTEHSNWSDTPEWRQRGRVSGLLNVDGNPICKEGSWGSESFGVDIESTNRVVIKYRYSAFIYTPLELYLRSRKRNVVILTGVSSDICVYATAESALMLGFFPIMLRDCTAGTNADAHEEAVAKFERALGEVVQAAEVLRMWEDA